MAIGASWKRDLRLGQMAGVLTLGTIALGWQAHLSSDSVEMGLLLAATAIYGLAARLRARRSRHRGWGAFAAAATVVVAIALSWLYGGELEVATAIAAVLVGGLWWRACAIALAFSELPEARAR